MLDQLKQLQEQHKKAIAAGATGRATFLDRQIRQLVSQIQNTDPLDLDDDLAEGMFGNDNNTLARRAYTGSRSKSAADRAKADKAASRFNKRNPNTPMSKNDEGNWEHHPKVQAAANRYNPRNGSFRKEDVDGDDLPLDPYDITEITSAERAASAAGNPTGSHGDWRINRGHQADIKSTKEHVDDAMIARVAAHIHHQHEKGHSLKTLEIGRLASNWIGQHHPEKNAQSAFPWQSRGHAGIYWHSSLGHRVARALRANHGWKDGSQRSQYGGREYALVKPAGRNKVTNESIEEGTFLSKKVKKIPRFNGYEYSSIADRMSDSHAEKIADDLHHKMLFGNKGKPSGIPHMRDEHIPTSKDGHVDQTDIRNYLHDKHGIHPNSEKGNVETHHVMHILKHKYGWKPSYKAAPWSTMTYTSYLQTMKHKLATPQARAKFRAAPKTQFEETQLVESDKEAIACLRRSRRARMAGDNDKAQEHLTAAQNLVGKDKAKELEADLAKKRIQVSLKRAAKGPVVEDTEQLDERSKLSTFVKGVTGGYNRQAARISRELTRRTNAADDESDTHARSYANYNHPSSKEKYKSHEAAKYRWFDKKKKFAKDIASKTNSSTLKRAAEFGAPGEYSNEHNIRMKNYAGVRDSQIRGGLTYKMRKAKGYGSYPGAVKEDVENVNEDLGRMIDRMKAKHYVDQQRKADSNYYWTKTDGGGAYTTKGLKDLEREVSSLESRRENSPTANVDRDVLDKKIHKAKTKLSKMQNKLSKYKTRSVEYGKKIKAIDDKYKK